MSRIARLGGRTFGGVVGLPLQRPHKECTGLRIWNDDKRMTMKHREGLLLLLHDAIIVLK
jgi:hypothetical protein